MMIKKAIMLSALIGGSALAQDNSARVGFIRDTTPPVAEVLGTAAEGFDDITNLPGWIMDNRSNPVGTTDWFQGNIAVFTAQAGPDDSYIGANFNNTSGSDICNWLIMPDLGFLQSVTFWTRTGTGNTFPDRMFVLHSPTGGTTTGDCFNGFGDFTDTLIEINPDLNTGGYPDDWAQMTANVNGTGRVAFVYFVADGGPVGANSNFIGIDSLEYLAGSPEVDLQLDITNNVLGNVNLGDSVTFTEILTNNGPGDTNSAVISSTLSSGLDHVSNDCAATVTGQVVTWAATVANGATAMCNIVTTVTGFGQLTVSGSVVADETDTVPANNSGSSSVNGPVRVIPTLSQYGIMLLLAGLFFVARRRFAK